MRHILAVLAFLAVVPAHAQDISAQLAEIAGKDPVKAAVAAEAALRSPSATSRSLALEATLKSTDGRVRAIGYSYLIQKHKRLTIDLEIPASFVADEQDDLKRTLRNSPTLTVEVLGYKAENSTFDGMMYPHGPMSGSIARDGLTINKVINNAVDCVFRFNRVDAEYLTGTLICRTLTLKIRSALP